ncbi:MAG: porphobilinogen synthase [Candidatus Omnitrophota bacterium]|nr:porphobilinogen synthase [Candidatus Omnitrophota bacterium]
MQRLSSKDLIMPYFVIEGRNKKEPVADMPGIARLTIDNLLEEILEVKQLGIPRVLLFGACPRQYKDELASYAYAKNNIVSRAVAELKRKIKGIAVITDVCLCAYTSHGHCGILKTENRKQKTKNKVCIDNKETLKVLAKIALSHAQSGADWVAPSAMAKGQVLALREVLNKYGYKKTKILGYSAKFNSNFYGPFRNAASSAPLFGDRSGYQLDYSNAQGALKKIKEDIDSGADMVMVKPALSYLDIIKEAKRKFNYPLAAYNVSGEYALVKMGASIGLWQEKEVALEIITSIKRAGADYIITYHAKDVAKWIKQKNYLISPSVI